MNLAKKILYVYATWQWCSTVRSYLIRLMWWGSCRWELWTEMGHEITQLLISYIPAALSCNKETVKEIKLHDILKKILVNAFNPLSDNCKIKRRYAHKRSPCRSVNTPPVPLYLYSPDMPSWRELPSRL